MNHLHRMLIKSSAMCAAILTHRTFLWEAQRQRTGLNWQTHESRHKLLREKLNAVRHTPQEDKLLLNTCFFSDRRYLALRFRVEGGVTGCVPQFLWESGRLRMGPGKGCSVYNVTSSSNFPECYRDVNLILCSGNFPVVEQIWFVHAHNCFDPVSMGFFALFLLLKVVSDFNKLRFKLL